MTFRQILNKMQSCVDETLTEDKLLDMDIRVVVPTILGLKTSNISIKDCYVKTETSFHRETNRTEIDRQYIAIDTNTAT